MKKINMFSPAKRFYNVDSRTVDLPGTDLNLMGCTLGPGEESQPHNHFEDELFIFTAGHGVVKTVQEMLEVRAGDAVHCQRFEPHTLRNLSDQHPLTFHSLYWDAGRSNAPAAAPVVDTLIYATPPTPNGDLHLGHLSGPYIAGDVLKRVLGNTGARVFYGSGRDDNQTYVVTCATKEGIGPGACADHYAQAIRETWQGYGIDMDVFITPDTQGEYADFVHHYLQRLHEQDVIYAKDTPVFVDDAGNALHEAFIHGGCPHCGESSDGNACEACGQPNQCTDLTQPRVKRDGHQPRLKIETRLFFRLSAFADELLKYIQTANMPAHVYQLCHTMLRQGLPDICISHRSDWGIRHRLPSVQDQVIYVWFEMAFGYLWGASDLPVDGSDRFARAEQCYSGAMDVVHCYGFDNAYYHTLLFPAIYLALGLTPPRHHIVNELLDLDGSKFSTSRRHLIWGREFLAEAGSDYARMALMLTRPEGVRTNFTVNEISEQLNDLFAQKLNGLIQRLDQCIARHGGSVPEPGAWLSDQKTYHEELCQWMDGYRQAASIQSFSPRRMAEQVAHVIHRASRFSAAQEHLLKSSAQPLSNHARTALALQAMTLRWLAYATYPLMPGISQQLSEWLNLPGLERDDVLAGSFFAGGHTLASRPPVKLHSVSAQALARLMPGHV
ncbi:Methionine--tRNA ligase [Pseudomonas sp. 24 E 13]|uniref:class I tRNA ligase family protein n=1 Tax=Pseudomonas sp. 24 E 13 TaxID=1844095 RepID=UPI000812AA9B|nr:class I tRNA ligase family protein [Pseudomonas sp. 24 E 13]CRM07040.1 Methionine--tRNA ligase [Pseudomonas sp. 24 E 13]